MATTNNSSRATPGPVRKLALYFMVRWRRFLESLETPGGKIFVLVLLIVFLLSVGALMAITNHPLASTGRTLLATAVGSLLGFLAGYVKANGKKQ